tara:strand:+ start:1277 stop:1582 length:306 start_codon:yes stop_codon:yes gene_type:complete
VPFDRSDKRRAFCILAYLNQFINIKIVVYFLDCLFNYWPFIQFFLAWQVFFRLFEFNRDRKSGCHETVPLEAEIALSYLPNQQGCLQSFGSFTMAGNTTRK